MQYLTTILLTYLEIISALPETVDTNTPFQMITLFSTQFSMKFFNYYINQKHFLQSTITRFKHYALSTRVPHLHKANSPARSLETYFKYEITRKIQKSSKTSLLTTTVRTTKVRNAHFDFDWFKFNNRLASCKFERSIGVPVPDWCDMRLLFVGT